MVRLSLLLAIAQLVLAVCALISCLSADKDGIRALPRAAWVLLILFFPLIGSVAWFFAGRPPTGRSAGRQGIFGGPPAGAKRPPAPDDDPDFLRSLNAEQARRDRELFDRWEEDLRRREEDLRRRETGEPPREETP